MDFALMEETERFRSFDAALGVPGTAVYSFRSTGVLTGPRGNLRLSRRLDGILRVERLIQCHAIIEILTGLLVSTFAPRAGANGRGTHERQRAIIGARRQFIRPRSRPPAVITKNNSAPRQTRIEPTMAREELLVFIAIAIPSINSGDPTTNSQN